MSPLRHFPCEADSVTAARRWIRQQLRARPVELIEAAELMTSELATNCVRHAGTEFELSVRLVDDDIRVEVRDSGGGRPRVLSPAAQEPSGRGLRIVDALSDEWGIIPASDGKTVWFTLRGATGARTGRGAAPRRGARKALARRPLESIRRWREAKGETG